jgi:membrane-associated phospholipid phosphatase
VRSYALNQLIKLVVPRKRPEGPALISTGSNRSFPSAHATTSFAAARALPLPKPPLYALAAAMAASRVALNVHHPSDVLAGAALGTLVAR